MEKTKKEKFKCVFCDSSNILCKLAHSRKYIIEKPIQSTMIEKIFSKRHAEEIGENNIPERHIKEKCEKNSF